MSLRKCTKSRIIPIKFYSFDNEYIQSRKKLRKSVVSFFVPMDSNDIDFQNKLYYNVLGLIPDQDKKILHSGIPCRVQYF